MIDLNGDKLNLDIVPLKGGTLVGTFTLDGVKVELVKADPPRYAYSNSKRDRGLRKVIINGEHRANVALPHGFGKYPSLRPLQSDGAYAGKGIEDFWGDPNKNVFTLQSAITKIVKRFKAGELRTVEEIKANHDRLETEQKAREAEFAARAQQRRDERKTHIAGLQSILDEKMNLTAEQHGALTWAIRQFQ